ncbi:MAG: translocation/assembly module TamB domain-containing protein [Oligoflexus sp.]
MKRWIKRVFLSLFAFIAMLFVSVLMMILFFPQALVNHWTVSQALHLTDRYVMPLQWQSLEVSASSPKILRKAFVVKLRGFCLEEPRICSKDIDLAAHLDLHPSRPRMPQLGPIQVTGLVGEIELGPPVEEKEESSPLAEPLRPLMWLRQLEDIVIEPIEVEIVQFQLKQQDAEILTASGQIQLTGLHRHNWQEGERAEDRLRVAAKGRFQGQDFAVDANLQLQDYQSILDEKARITGEAKGNWLEHRVNAKLDFEPLTNSRGRATMLRLRYQSPLARLNFLSQGRLSQGKFVGRIEATAKEIMDDILDVELTPCQVTANWGERLRDQMSLDLHCEGKTIRKARLAQDELVAKFIPEFINFNFDIVGKYQQAEAGDAYEVQSKLRIEDIKNGSLHLGGVVQAEARKSEEQASPAFNVKLDIEAAIREFGQMVEQLAGSPLAIPAPLNQLRGVAACQIRGRYVSYDERDQFPLSCQVDLESVKQAVEFDMGGQLVLEKKQDKIQPHLNADLNLQRLEVALPDFNIGQQVPKLRPDERFVVGQVPPREAKKAFVQQETKKNEKEPPINFSYLLRVRSAREDSILVHSNLLGQPLPLAVNVDISSEEGMDGQVSIADYRVRLFRREAFVQNVRLELHRDRQDHPIAGRVLFDTRDYTIQLNILGTAESPTFVLESTPPLPEKDLYGILLFGSQPEALTSDKVRSLDETRAAIADGAIGLLSMYYLASTPIESIGYNPHDGMFTARVALQEGLTLTVGTDAERAGEVGLRKRIGENWSIETRALRGEEGAAGRAVAMLRWGLRY